MLIAELYPSFCTRRCGFLIHQLRCSQLYFECSTAHYLHVGKRKKNHSFILSFLLNHLKHIPYLMVIFLFCFTLWWLLYHTFIKSYIFYFHQSQHQNQQLKEIWNDGGDTTEGKSPLYSWCVKYIDFIINFCLKLYKLTLDLNWTFAFQWKNNGPEISVKQLKQQLILAGCVRKRAG